jgi:glutamyl-Q tRNA(Asp) synthetase
VFVTRFAPSPTGYLHRGHAFSALSAYQAAQAAGGRFILRIEDIDATRCRPEFEAAILEDLAWLGLSWEAPVRRQSDHLSEYQAVLDRLQADGLLYRCFRTRREVAEAIASAPHGAMEVFRGQALPPAEEAARLAAGEPYAWRLSLAAAEARLGGFGDLFFVEEGEGVIPARPELGGDVVLARKDVGVAYHLAVVVDDARQGITHVIRGRDLFEATHVQRLLQALIPAAPLLGGMAAGEPRGEASGGASLPTPVYRHHRLLAGPDGKRFAKRDRAETLRSLREQGMSAHDLRRELGFG